MISPIAPRDPPAPGDNIRRLKFTVGVDYQEHSRRQQTNLHSELVTRIAPTSPVALIVQAFNHLL